MIRLGETLKLSVLMFFILINLSLIVNVYGQNMANIRVTSLGAVVRTSQESSSSEGVLWYTRHENGGINEWTVGGGWNGFMSEDPPASTLTLIEDFLGKNWIRSRIDQPWVPSDEWTDYKCRAEVMRRGNLDQDGSWVLTESDVYYGVRLYLPSDFRVDTGTGNWANGASLIQIKEQSSIGWGGGLRIWSTTQTFRIATHHYINGEWVYEELARDIPYILGRPFTVIIHIDASQNGVFESWIDGELVAQDYDDYRMEPESIELGHLSRYFQVGLYCGVDQNAKEMYFTDAIVATNLEAVQAFFSE